jgi:hypothetical protein
MGSNPPFPAGPVAGGRSYEYTYTAANANDIETLPVATPLSVFVPSNANVKLTLPPITNPLIAKYFIYRGGGNSPNSPRHRVGSTTLATFTDTQAENATYFAAPTPPLAAPKSERYSIALTCDRASSVADWIHTLLLYCQGAFTFDSQGRLELRIDKKIPAGYVPPITFTEGVNVFPNSTTLQRRDQTQRYNQVEVWFNDVDDNFTRKRAFVQTDAVKNGLETPRSASFELPGIPDANIATRRAIRLLNAMQIDLATDWMTTREALGVQPWDVVPLTAAGLSAQLVRVKSIQAAGENLHIYAEQYSDEVYSDVITLGGAPVSTTGPTPDDVPPDPTDVSVIEVPPDDPLLDPNSYLLVSWTPAATSLYKATQVLVDRGLGVEDLGLQATGPVKILRPRRGVWHTITLRTITTYDKPSPGVVVYILPQYAPPPPDVVNLTAPHETDDERGTLYWDAPNYDFIKDYQISDFPRFRNRTSVEAASPFETARARPRGVVWWNKPEPPTQQEPMRIPGLVHGDGYNTDLTLDVIVKVRSVAGELSTGVRTSWNISAKATTTTVVGRDPRGLAAAGDYIWTANYATDEIERFVRESATPDLTLAVGDRPYGVAFSAETSLYGDLWVANFGADTVTRAVLDADGAATVATTIALTAGDGPCRLWWDGTQIWVACFTSGKVRRISPSANAVIDPEISFGSSTKPTVPVREGIYVFTPCNGDNQLRIIQVDNDFASTPPEA